jgi:pyruvate-ferredoxin/flavodoxin oxidoreductase
MTKHALNVHAGHDDYHAIDDTGFFQLFAKDAQGAADLNLIAHRIAELALNPGVLAQDGFLTSHVIESMRMPERDLVREYLGDPADLIDSPPLTLGVRGPAAHPGCSTSTTRRSRRGANRRLPAGRRGPAAVLLRSWPVHRSGDGEYAALCRRHYARVMGYGLEMRVSGGVSGRERRGWRPSPPPAACGWAC